VKTRSRGDAGHFTRTRIWESGTTQLFACSARADAAAPSGGMAVVTAAWGMQAAVMVQVRVRASNYLLNRKATPANDHSFLFAFSPDSTGPLSKSAFFARRRRYESRS